MVVEGAEGLDDFSSGCDFYLEFVYLIEGPTDLLGYVHRDDPFAIFVSSAEHLNPLREHSVSEKQKEGAGCEYGSHRSGHVTVRDSLLGIFADNTIY